MEETAYRAVAIVGVGAILPDAPDAPSFWHNIANSRYSISEVDARRWDTKLYYDPDPKAVDKSYSKIGGWVREYQWHPMKWHLPIPPCVSDAMDEAQKWAIIATREALTDFGYPARALDCERTAVILGNAMAGEKHYQTALRISLPEYLRELAATASFESLPAAVRKTLMAELSARVRANYPEITEDTMPGELGNCLAGRIANLFNFHGANYVVDAACASAMAAINAAVEGLVEGDYDSVITGGIDRNMGAATFVKFCKIGALSATGTRPYADGADGFVMGEGAVVLILKRLADAERGGDKIYAVLRGVGGASDGKGKGITAPNPVGQRLAIERAWANAGLSPATAGLIEGHGTSTRVGDVVETEALAAVLNGSGAPLQSIALGSVKSNIGHLKAAAGAAGLLKTVFALHEKVLPPSLNCERPNPNIDFARSPLFVNKELQSWPAATCGVRRAGVSAFGFGGTNFHMVLEEYLPGRLTTDGKRTVAVATPQGNGVVNAPADSNCAHSSEANSEAKRPLRGALVVGAADEGALVVRLQTLLERANSGAAPWPQAPRAEDLRAPVRVAIDYGTAAELAEKLGKALKAFALPAMWKALRAQGIFRGYGAAAKVAFLYPGQGSQYVNMLKTLAAREPVVAEVFAEADKVMAPLVGKPISQFIFADENDQEAVAVADESLRQTAITQPAVLTVDNALTQLFNAYGIAPDMVMGHSLGEYGALVAAGAMPFADALEAVSARGREMTRVSVADNGRMAAVFAPSAEIERVLATVDGYVVIANINSNSQAVIGGASAAVEAAMQAFTAAGYEAVALPVSHAFHTSIVAPASEPLRQQLERLRLTAPQLPIIANVTGQFYPRAGDVKGEMLELLAKQVAAPVQFVKGLRTLYEAGARVFVEMGPKRALQGFVDDVLGSDGEVISLCTNHPKLGDVVSFNQALCGLYAAGLGAGRAQEIEITHTTVKPAVQLAAAQSTRTNIMPNSNDRFTELGRLFAEFVERGRELCADAPAAATVAKPVPVVITGAAMGLPGGPAIFDENNVGRLLRGEQMIDVIPTRFRQAIADKHITRLVKSEAGGSFEAITDPADVIKLAARGGALDLEHDFGIPAERVAALDRVTQLAVGAGVEALRDAGIPLVLHYKTTTKGTQLPDRWGLPRSMRDDTGVIFASAFPGYDALVQDLTRYHADRARREQLARLERLRAKVNNNELLARELDDQVSELRAQIGKEPFNFDRRFLFRVLAMGHSQFAEIIGARGPNTQINSACASTTQAVALAEDWIGAGRCQRVIIVAADDVTSDNLLEWFGAGFLATGAAATDETVAAAALPFDKHRHGMLLGMGAAAIVVESTASARARGLQPICEVLSTATANSAFHGTRLDVEHISSVMETLVAQAESRWDVRRAEIAPQTVFISHETYTPARGGSAAAEIHALRRVFGAQADSIVIANTKGFTGHPMGVGIEDVVAVKTIETGIVPPVANFKEIDPELGQLNLSRGGAYPVNFALRLGAGFGSQISMMLLRWLPTADGARRTPEALGYNYRIVDKERFVNWLAATSGINEPELEIVNRTLRVKEFQSVQSSGEVAVAAVVKQEDAVAKTVEPAVVAVVAKPVAVAAVTNAITNAVPDTANNDEEVKAQVLRIVAEKTGYPEDMLDLDLDLEADLGVDTVKQAEVFAAIREQYQIPRQDNLRLRDYATLAHVIRFVLDHQPASATPQAVVAAPAVVAEPSAAPAPVNDEEIRVNVLKIVAEKTGYPEDMLDLDLDLEADLGVDTVKQAEIFLAIRTIYNIPRDENLKLRDFPTLAHVIKFVLDRRPQPSATVVPPPAAQGASQVKPVASIKPADLEAADAMPRRIAAAVVRPLLEYCKSTGVTLGAGSRVVVMPDRGGAAEALVARLTQAGAEVLMLDNGVDTETVLAQVERWRDAGAIQGVYWLPALDAEGALAAMTLDDWHNALRPRIKQLYAVMRALYQQIAARGTFLLTATRLGGRHGYDAAGAFAPMGGAVTGFTKAYARERAAALVKVVDFAATAQADEIARALCDETVKDNGAVEIGYQGGLRWTVGLEARAAVQDGMELNKDTVFVVTGAAGSIVSAITADLAAASGGIFYLLDLTPRPDDANADLQRFTTDRDGLKRDIFERLKARGERATPAMVEKELAALERAQAALSAIKAVEGAGGTVHYHSGDLRDPAAVAKVVEDIRARYGRVDVLVHAAGLEISRFLTDKEAREFDLVFDVKSDGWFNLMRAIGDMPLGATVAFSSIAGRFGNGGQTDYSAANDLLCKFASSLRATRAGTHALAIDWSAWDQIGMASRGSIPKMMELAGIDMIDPKAGIPAVRRELVKGGDAEVVIAGRLGMLVSERDETGGLDCQAIASLLTGPMTGRAVAMSMEQGLIVETVLDPRQQPFLNDHRIDGTAVLPGVMGLEGFAEVAAALLPGWRVAAIEDVELLAPVKFYRDEPRTLRLSAQCRGDGGSEELVVSCRLATSRQLPNQTAPQETVNFTANVRLSRAAAKAIEGEIPKVKEQGQVQAAEIYRVYFHGPAYQVLESAWKNGAVTGLMARGLPANHQPDKLPTLVAPRLIELCFQTAGIWQMGITGQLGLPSHIDRITIFQVGAHDAGDGRIFATVMPDSEGTKFSARVIDDRGRVYIVMEGYRTAVLPESIDGERRKALAVAMA